MLLPVWWKRWIYFWTTIQYMRPKALCFQVVRLCVGTCLRAYVRAAAFLIGYNCWLLVSFMVLNVLHLEGVYPAGVTMNTSMTMFVNHEVRTCRPYAHFQQLMSDGAPLSSSKIRPSAARRTCAVRRWLLLWLDRSMTAQRRAQANTAVKLLTGHRSVADCRRSCRARTC